MIKDKCERRKTLYWKSGSIEIVEESKTLQKKDSREKDHRVLVYTRILLFEQYIQDGLIGGVFPRIETVFFKWVYYQSSRRNVDLYYEYSLK